MSPDILVAACEGGVAPPLESMNADDLAEVRRLAVDMSVSGRTKLVEACSSLSEAIPLLADCVTELGFFLAVSRSLLSADGRENMSAFGMEAGVVPWPTDGAAQVQGLATVLADYRAWLWALSSIFSIEVVAAIPALVADREWPVRQAAVEALGPHVSTDPVAKAALIGALTDSRKGVRKTAAAALKEQLSEDEYSEILSEREADMRSLMDRALSAKDALADGVKGIPGLGALMRLAAAGAGAASGGVASVGNAVSDGLAKAGGLFRRKDSQEGEE